MQGGVKRCVQGERSVKKKDYVGCPAWGRASRPCPVTLGHAAVGVEPHEAINYRAVVAGELATDKHIAAAIGGWPDRVHVLVIPVPTRMPVSIAPVAVSRTSRFTEVPL